MTFIVLEGFSGSGKTSIAKMFEADGWFRVAESAHSLPPEIPVADRADSYSDYALMGQALTSTYMIAKRRASQKVVAEGYLLSDLTYYRIRESLGLSRNYEAFKGLVKQLLLDKLLVPNMYLLLNTRGDEIAKRQVEKPERDKNLSEYFMTKYYEFIRDLHREFGQNDLVEVDTNTDAKETYSRILVVLKERGVR